MKNIKINSMNDHLVLVNWENVHFVKETISAFGEPYREICFSNRAIISTQETLQEIENKLAEAPENESR